MRRVLCVLYYFPPAGGVGVQRALKFLRYLPAHGWEPVVLTVPASAAFPVRDPSLLAQLPETLPVHRTRCPELYGLYRWLTRQPAERALDVTSDPAAAHGGRLHRLLENVRATLFIPDGRMAWTPFAVSGGHRLMREYGCAAIFSSGPPFTTHVIARALHRRSGRPWIADYRDPWTQASFYPARPAWARRIDERLEASCLAEAAYTVVVGEGMASEFRDRYPNLPAERLVVLPNGFDPADFEEIPHEQPEPFRITHSGSLFQRREPGPFLDALAQLARDEPAFAAGARLALPGRIDPAIAARLARPPLDCLVERPGHLPHRASLALLRRSSLLLLLLGTDVQSRHCLTGKLFEYLAAGVPILALAPPEGDAARLLRSAGAGWVIPPGDRAAIRGALTRLWAADRAARAEGARPPFALGLQRDAARIATYSRPAQAGRLAALLERAVGSAAS